MSERFTRGKGRFGKLEVGVGGLDVEGPLVGTTPTTDYFCDSARSASGVGTSWRTAFITISEAMTTAAALATRGRVRIFVAPGGYTEDIVTPLNTECPFGQLIAWNPTDFSFGGAWLLASTAATPTLTIRARGWRVTGFEIAAVANGKSVLLDGATANSNAAGTELSHNLITGWGAAATIGIDAVKNGAPHTNVFSNHFSGCVGSGIVCTESATDQPRFWRIFDNVFVDNGNHINMNPRGFKESFIYDNRFIKVGANRTATVQIDNRGGSNTIIGPLNALSDSYDNAGGYYAGTAEDWLGNYNIAGVTTANPAA